MAEAPATLLVPGDTVAGEPIRVMELAPGLVHTEEFTLNRLRGDVESAAKPYVDVTPLTAEQIARCSSARSRRRACFARIAGR